MYNLAMSTTPLTNQAIEIHIRTYRSILKASGSVKIEQLIDSHVQMNSVLHEKAANDDIDTAAFIYSMLRLPQNISSVEQVILGQSFAVFKNAGYGRVNAWKQVQAPGRRRKMFYDGKKQLAAYITSVTDLDDVITLLTAYQIEWNKLHSKLSKIKDVKAYMNTLLSAEDVGRLQSIFGNDYTQFLLTAKNKKVSFEVRLLSGSYVEYAKSTSSWWKMIARTLHKLNIPRRPIYFVSSNTHSLSNLLTRFALYEEQELISYLYKQQNTELITLWESIQKGDFLASKEHFLYYIAKKYSKENPDILERKNVREKKLGVSTINAFKYLDIDTQIIEISKLSESTELGKKMNLQLSKLAKSNAIIFNIDYPLGWAAYQVLVALGENADLIRGVYVMGKAATLTGKIGDILIPGSVFDQHTKNSYVINNAFSAKDFTSIFKTGAILDNQKSMTAKGTFFENETLLKHWFENEYTIVEMESGPYLNAVYEFIYYNRYEEGQFISLVNPPFELGIANYASDTPYSKAKNLGVRNLSYEGVEPTYAISHVILKKILERELSFIR